jgi:preprotein translocase subunit SecF
MLAGLASQGLKNHPLLLVAGERVGLKPFLLQIYDVHYKKLLMLSFLLLVACIGVLAHHKLTTGEFVDKGVSLKGGLTLTVPATEADSDSFEAALSTSFPEADVSVRGTTEGGVLKALIIEASDIQEDTLVAALKENGLAMIPGSYSVEVMGSSLGESFYRQTVIAILLSFLFMAVVVFITFRSTLPSIFIILAAASEIISTIAVVNLLGVKLSTAGVAAFLMIIGYSVDTNILLTVKVLKHQTRTVFERTAETMRTGVLMSLTAFAATMVGYFFIQSDAVKQIMLIISIGLLFDIVYTWLQNAGILRWYLERVHAEHGEKHG